MSVALDERAAAIARDFPLLAQPTSRGQRLVYLDSAATAQKPRAVIDALVHYYEHDNANVHRGVYELAERATDAFEGARASVARFIGAAEPAEIVWTAGATAAINLVAYSWGLANLRAGDAILLSELEHHANLVPWQMVAERTGAELRFIPIDGEGRHVLEGLDALLHRSKLVALAQVSNTLGTIAPLAEIVPRAHAAGALVLVDGAQSAPHFSVDVRALEVDFFAASAHKMCGPTGIGFLYGKRALLEAMPPFLTGGDMIREVQYRRTTFNEIPWKFEAGTGNIAGAAGLAAAVAYLEGIGMDAVAAHERSLTSYALDRLAPLEERGLAIYGPRDRKLRSGLISFNLGDVHAHDVASILDTEGVAIRAGHHCTMPLIEKMGLAATARASFYLYNTEDDVERLASALERAASLFRIG
ncbi:MAG: SufS family cysteine desulfurase [Vulcanimicrobiaceae bacterium]